MAIGLVKQSVVLAYLTLVVCGTSAVASATLLVEASLNSPAVAPYALSDSSWNGRRKVFEEAIRQIGTKDGLSAQLRDELSRFADSCPVSLGAPSKDCIAQIYREASRYVGWRRCSDNSCEEIPRHKRCATHPTNLFEQQLLYKDSIVLGTIFQDYTHSYASAAAAWVSDQIRDRHGILGKNIAVVSCTVNEDSSIDNLTPDEAARSTAQYLADEVGVTLIIGADSSDRTIAVLNALVGRDVTVISPAATSTVLSQLNTNMGKTPGPWFLRTIPSNKYEGAVLADLALRATPKDGLVALISQNSAYGSDLAQFVSRGLHRAMLNNQTLFERHFSGEFQLQSVLTELKSVSNLRSIVLISSTATDYQLLLNSVRLAEIRDPDGQPPSLLFPDSAMVETIFSDVPESILVRVLGTRPSVTHRDFLAKLNAGFRSDRPDLNEDLESGYGAETLDAVWLSAYSLAFTADRHGIVIGAAMIDQLLALATQSGSSCTHLQLGPDTLREWENAFSAKVPICPEGVSGPITIERTTGDMVGSYETWIPHTNPEGRSTVAFVSRSTR
jgi:ABC-type branched-subunit amino acid transport system substrate-binding protein